MPGGQSYSFPHCIGLQGLPALQGKHPRTKLGGVCNSGILEAEASRLLELGSSRPTWATWKDSHLKQEKLRRLSVFLSIYRLTETEDSLWV